MVCGVNVTGGLLGLVDVPASSFIICKVTSVISGLAHDCNVALVAVGDLLLKEVVGLGYLLLNDLEVLSLGDLLLSDQVGLGNLLLSDHVGLGNLLVSEVITEILVSI